MTDTIGVEIDGRRVSVAAGISVAAALLDQGVTAFRASVRGEPRGPLCGMGICHECRVTIDGVAHRRACLVPVAAGMRVTTASAPPAATTASTTSTTSTTSARAGTTSAGVERAIAAPSHLRADIAIVGAGPAGIAAALAATRAGRSVVVLDQGIGAGGQIWRHGPTAPPPREARPWLDRLERSGATMFFGTSVVDLRASGGGFALVAQRGTTPCRVEAERVVLATGARERFLPFPGWTLPGVTGVGGVQALREMGTTVAGKRAVVAGTGPLLLPVAAALARAGARIVLVAEQAPAGVVAAFAASLWRRPGLLLRAAGYRAAFRTARYSPGTWVTSAGGTHGVERVTVTDGRRVETLGCDLLCVAYGLVPATELARLAGCALSNGAVVVDDRQETSVPGVHCAGEPTGIGGSELSLLEGEIAGLCAAGRDRDAVRLLGARAALRRAAAGMERAFAPRAELRDACTDDTIVCRCEDVARGELDAGWCARQARLYTRIGMGPCQGRVCGAALDFLFGWRSDAVRPPIEPTLPSTLLAAAAPDADAAGAFDPLQPGAA